MKKILLHSATFNTFWAHYYFFKDDFFVNRLKELGYELLFSNISAPEDADAIVFIDSNTLGPRRLSGIRKIKYSIKSLIRKPAISRDFYGECVEKGLLPKCILLVCEGLVGMPENHTQKIETLFPSILTWNDDLVNGTNIKKYNWPQPVIWPEFAVRAFGDKKLVVNISGNKYASHPLELYTERRKLIRLLEKECGDQFDLYGIGWNKPATYLQRFLKASVPLYRSYRGEAPGKTEVFPGYKFAICYENACVNGWITEKIFDCMRSNCVPVYLGAPNVLDFIDADTFIDRNKFASDAELIRFMKEMSQEEYNKYLVAIKRYLEGPRFAAFLSPALAGAIADAATSLSVHQ